MKTFHIICAGREERLCIEREQGDFVVACDGGFEYAKKYNVKCDLLLGDFDSLGYQPDNLDIPVLKLPCEKDETDTFAAVKLGIKKGFDNFVLHSATGGEVDHTLANVGALIHLANNKKLNAMTDGERKITAVHNATASFGKNPRGRISVFCAERSCRVKINGLKYDFDGEITNDFPIGVSNEFIGNQATVQIIGTAIIVYPAHLQIHILN